MPILAESSAVVATDRFASKFELTNLERTFREALRGKRLKGIDRLDPRQFDRTRKEHFHVIRRKCLDGSYRFAPYLELLKSKGRAKHPRVISIPTVRDRLVLRTLKDYLHETCPDCVGRTLPNAHVREVKAILAKHDLDTVSCLRLDIAAFYDSVDHDRLSEKLESRVPSSAARELIMRAVRTPTVPAGYRRGSDAGKRNRLGVPQGLSISNILAEIYLREFDDAMETLGISYHRYVDDILIFVPAGAETATQQSVEALLHDLGLQLNASKSAPHPAGGPFEYLGYRFQWPVVTVRTPSVDRFFAGIAAHFSNYASRLNLHLKSHPWITPAQAEEVFIEDLNERLTGAISQNRRYGWLFYFLEIEDLGLLHKVDAIVDGFFRRFGVSGGTRPVGAKRMVRALFEARHYPARGYILQYEKFATSADQKKYLERRGHVDPSMPVSDEEISEIFNRVRNLHLARLEADVGVLS
jgi:RNA-directed DNA polymerase